MKHPLPLSQTNSENPALGQFGWNGRSCRRRGISLIEILLFITIAASVMTSAMLCLDGLFRIQRQTNEALVVHRALSRMADQLRDDVHQASACELATTPEGSAALLKLSGHDETVVSYKFTEGKLRRIAQRGEQPVHREFYRLGKRSDVQWQIEQGTPTVVTCIVSGTHVPDVPLVPRFRLELILGRAAGEVLSEAGLAIPHDSRN